MTQSSDGDRRDLFDAWAAGYDESLSSDGYPFAGYGDVIAAVIAAAQIEPDLHVLDLGAGTGNLTAHLVALSAEVWGIDFSEEMLRQARAKVPTARFVRFDLQDPWPSELPDRFDRIVSTYVFHEFDDDDKVRLLVGLARNRLTPGGRIVIGDITFPDDRELAACRNTCASVWDETEHYWVADRMEQRIESAGLSVRHEQISFCGGLFMMELRPEATA